MTLLNAELGFYEVLSLLDSESVSNRYFVVL